MKCESINNNMKKKKIITVLIIIFISIVLGCFIIYCKTKKQDIQVNGGVENGGFIYKADGNVELGEGLVAHGFYSVDGSIVDAGELYALSDGIFRGTYEFQQNQQESNYMLMVLVDYLQSPFQADGKIYNNYLFSLIGDSKASIDIEIDLSGQDAKEIMLLTVVEPYNMNLTHHNILASRMIYTKRVQLTKEKTDIEYDKNYQEMQFISNNMFELAKSHEEVKMTPECISGEEIELALGSAESEDMEYAIVAFSNWKQVPLWNNQMVQFIKIPVGKNIYCKIPLPRVEADTPYQIMGFERPFTREDVYVHDNATLRTIIKKEE